MLRNISKVVVILLVVLIVTSTTVAVTASTCEISQTTSSAYDLDPDGDGHISWAEFWSFVGAWLGGGGDIPGFL